MKKLYFEEAHINFGGIIQRCDYFNNEMRIGSTACQQCIFYAGIEYEEPYNYESTPFSWQNDAKSKRGYVFCKEGDSDFESKLNGLRKTPWLVPGWLYLFKKEYYWFIGFEEDGSLKFKKNIAGKTYIFSDGSLFKPLNTPWNFAPLFVNYILIRYNGDWNFGSKGEEALWMSDFLPWKDCPNHLKGAPKEPAKWERPEFAKW